MFTFPALESRTEDGDFYSAISEIQDEKRTYEYETTKWTPKNYSGGFFGTIPLFYGLINSLNGATTALGMSIGFEAVKDTLSRAGFQVKNPFPSMLLGAIDQTPINVLEGYLTLASQGVHKKPYVIKRILGSRGDILYSHSPNEERVFQAQKVRALISMLELVPKFGTTQWMNGKMAHSFFGKTGTTNNSVDAWFAGADPEITTVVWVRS